MRAVDNRFVGALAARQLGNDVARLARRDRAVQRGGEHGLSHGHGAESALAGGVAQRVEVQPGGLEQRAGVLAGDPALHRQARRGIVLGTQGKLRAAPAALHHVPAVSRAGRVVNEDGGRGALARGFLELVGPAPVIGHAPAFEQARVIVVEAGVVDQHDHGFALDVQALVIVPAGLGGVDAIADEDHRACLHLDVGLPSARAHHHLLAERQRVRRAGDAHLQLAGGCVGFGFDHRHGLEKAVAVARLQAQAQELLAKVGDGLVLAGAAGLATTEIVGGEHADVGGKILGGDLRAERVPRLLVGGDQRRFRGRDGRIAGRGQGRAGRVLLGGFVLAGAECQGEQRDGSGATVDHAGLLTDPRSMTGRFLHAHKPGDSARL